MKKIKLINKDNLLMVIGVVSGLLFPVILFLLSYVFFSLYEEDIFFHNFLRLISEFYGIFWLVLIITLFLLFVSWILNLIRTKKNYSLRAVLICYFIFYSIILILFGILMFGGRSGLE